MGLRINTNDLAIAAERNLGINQRNLSKTMQRLATGSRIVHAADDPAGLAISDTLNAQIRSLGTAIRNAQDGISLIQVYEGGTNQLNNMIIRMRELAMQAASDTVGDRERGMINNEFVELQNEVNRVAMTANYSGKFLLNGDTHQFDIQVGTNNNPQVDRISFAPGDTNLTADALGLEGLAVDNKDDAQEVLEVIDEALRRVNEVRSKVGSAQSRLENAMNAQGIFRENLSAARSRIRDADLAEESVNLARDSILRQAGVAILTQANETPRLALQLLKF